MARRPKTTSIYDRLAENEQNIISTENLLNQLKSEREELLKEKDDYEMRQAWSKIKEQGLTLQEVEKLLVCKIKTEKSSTSNNDTK